MKRANIKEAKDIIIKLGDDKLNFECFTIALGISPNANFVLEVCKKEKEVQYRRIAAFMTGVVEYVPSYYTDLISARAVLDRGISEVLTQIVSGLSGDNKLMRMKIPDLETSFKFIDFSYSFF